MVSFEYRDLLVQVWSDETPGFFRARAEEEFGRATPPARIYLPFDDRWFIQYADRLEALNSRELHYVGARLFDCLFQGEILRLYVHLMEQIRNTGAKLRVRLKLDPDIVARLPWECLYDTRNGRFFSDYTELTLVRYHRPAGAEPASVPARSPLRVLLLSEGRGDDGPPRVAREAKTVRCALGELEAEGLVSVFEAGSALGGAELTFESLATVLSRNFDVLHLICDADWDGSASLVFGGEAIGLPAFSREIAAASPCLVVWSGGERAGTVGPALAASLLDTIPAFLSQRHRVPDELLVRYTTALYRALANVKPVDGALAEARAEVLSQFPTENEWLSPALYLSRKDATILHHLSRGSVTDVYQISEGRYRRRLRETLNRFWPKPERYFPQSHQWMARGASLTSYMHAVEFLGQPQSVSELCNRFRRLFLLGGAGAGKSMALYRLFYEAARPVLSYETKSPLPIYVSLPDLGESSNLFDLLASGLDRDLFSSDLEEGRFLFLLDSLDGLSANGAARRTECLNAFMRDYPLNRFVVTARRPTPRLLDIPDWAEALPFTEWESVEFLVAEDAMRPEAARILHQQLSKSLGSRAGNPQILGLARRLWREGARVPSKLTEIFLSFFRIAGGGMSPETRETLLPQLAFFMSKRDRLSLLKEHLQEDRRPRDLTGLAQEVAFRSMGFTVDELIAEVQKTRLLRGPRAFTFPSAAFQEFLTAYALRNAAPSTVMSLIPPADWRELDDAVDQPVNLSRGPFHGAIPFLCGLREDGPRLIERLVERDLVLASECYPEAPPSKTVDLLLRAAVERTLASSDPLDQRMACLALQARGDRWAVDWLEELADAAGPARAAALSSLGFLRSQRSVPVLESAAADRDPAVAKAAIDALARIKAG